MARWCAVALPLLCAATLAQDVEPLAPDPARDARIAELIEELLSIADPYDGITMTSGGGVGFDAVGKREDTPPAFRGLVRLGPAAIPALLKHLDDKRETKLSFSWVVEDMGTRMRLRPEIPAGSQEERVRIRRELGVGAEKDGPAYWEPDAPIDGHVVTVGDCCFVILGQIVNRSYEAVRHQPSLLAIVSSPTREPRIAKVLRGRWGRADSRQLLAQSLYDDLGRGDGEAGAVLRLLTYYPDEAAPVMAKRIAEWRWDDYPFREGRGEELLRAAMSTRHALVRTEWLKLLDPSRPKAAQLAALAATPADPGEDARERIRAIRDRLSDLDVVLASIAALPGEEAPVAFTWLKREFAKVETRDQHKTMKILAALAALDEEESLPIFLAHTERLAEYGWGNIIDALGEARRPKLATALFRARLDMTDLIVPRPMPAPAWLTVGMRWCDLAAGVLAEARTDLAFDPKAALEERDRQIAAIRAALAR